MNSSLNKIPIVDSGEVKFVLAVVRSKTSLKPATRQLERHPADIIKRNVFAEEVENPRAGSEGVCSLGPLVEKQMKARHGKRYEEEITRLLQRGVPRGNDRRRYLDVASLLPWLAAQVRAGRTLALSSLPEDLPAEAKAEAEFVTAIGLRSHLTRLRRFSLRRNSGPLSAACHILVR